MDCAKEDLATAYENMKAGRYKAANNRAYYAIFHAIRAVLALDSVDLKEHCQIIDYFNENYFSANLLDNYLKVVIKYASDSRCRSDYEDFYVATLGEAMRNIDGAEGVLAAVEGHIASRLNAESIQQG